MNVHWHGPRVHAGVAETMRQGDVFLLPSIEDAFGLVTLEAMASALPVIVSEHVGASELITDAVDGLVVPPGDARALAAAVEELLESREMRTRMGMKARERVEHGCSWNEYGNRVVDLVLERGGQRAGTARGSKSSGER
jgi:glycosyltransferase involved in cell wall biosynthesis